MDVIDIEDHERSVYVEDEKNEKESWLKLTRNEGNNRTFMEQGMEQFMDDCICLSCHLSSIRISHRAITPLIPCRQVLLFIMTVMVKIILAHH